MHIPPVLEEAMIKLVTRLAGREVTGLSCRPASGGSINRAAYVSGGGVSVFVKWNNAERYPGMFEAEAKGLSLLEDPGCALVPEVYECSGAGGISWLAMEMVEYGTSDNESIHFFGLMLANLHRNIASKFGLDHDNYMGSLLQSNKQHESFPEFFIEERLLPQLKIALRKGSLTGRDEEAFGKLFNKLHSIIPKDFPSLVHGDFWCGNYISGTDFRTWLIDPAVSYNHRETDLAMSKMFGGFPKRFYESYLYYSPIAPGWEQRVEIFQLYPLLIHVNLFGGGYTRSVKSIIKRYG